MRRERKTQIINLTEYLDTRWRQKIIKTLKMNYSNALYYSENIEFVIDLLEYKNNNISEFNMHVVKKIAERLNLNSKYCIASTLLIRESSTKKLIAIVKSLGWGKYAGQFFFSSFS